MRAPLDPEEALVFVGAWLREGGYEFTTVTPESHRRVFARTSHARTVRDVFGWSLPFDAALLPQNVLAALDLADVIERRADGLFASRVRFSTLAHQLFVHSAYPTAGEHAVFFGPDTYRFCRALESIVAHADRALDLGAGSGAGGISIAHRCNRLVLSDCNPLAATLARVNAHLNGCADRVEIAVGDLFDAVRGDFDLVIANPPYIADACGRAYRDGGGELGTGLALRIMEDSVQRVRGRLVLYTGSPIREGVDPIREAASRIFAGKRWTYREIDPDVFGEELSSDTYATVERIAAVVLVADL